MISARVMDIKLREAAEGLGEENTGEAPTCPALFGCMEPYSVTFFVGGNIQPPVPGLLKHPQLHAVSGKTTASPFNAILALLLSCCTAKEWGL